MNGQEFPIGGRNSPKHEFPQQHQNQNQHVDFHHYTNPNGTPPPPPPHNQDLTIDGIPNGGGSNGAFPHRRSRASRTFKNPPQPHFCIREKTIDGKEVFINVLSWTRIANPDNPDAPIPLYGGMKVGKIPPGSPRAPPLVYAVMASPEVLKKAGRKCPDTPERMNLVDLMCEFVEAMNPTLHLSRKPEILKDRDLSGELKDVWSAVQACRDKGRVDSGPPENLVVYTEFGPETAPSYEQSQHQQQQFPHQHYQQPFGGEPFHQFQNHHHQQQPQQQQQQQPQSAITDSSDANTSEQHPDVPDCGGPVNDLHHALDELCQETDGLKIAGTAAKSNGLTLPTTSSTTSPSNSAESSPATSPSNNAAPVESNPVPANLATSPTSPTPTPAAAPATPQKESKNTSHFFPMFRSSKSSSVEKSAADSSGGAAEHAVDAGQPESTTATVTTPVKSSSKKSVGLNFFRRNKTDSKKAEPAATTTTVPVTPTKQKQQAQSQQQGVNPQVGEKQLLDKLDESLMHHTHHHHHHHGGNNGTGEIIENSSATIVAK